MRTLSFHIEATWLLTYYGCAFQKCNNFIRRHAKNHRHGVSGNQHTCRWLRPIRGWLSRTAPNRPRNSYPACGHAISAESPLAPINADLRHRWRRRQELPVVASKQNQCRRHHYQRRPSRWHRCGSPCNRNGHLFPWKCWQGMASWEPRANCSGRVRPEPGAVAKRGGSDPVQRQIRRLSCNQADYPVWSKN